MFLSLLSSNRFPRDDEPLGANRGWRGPFSRFTVAGYGMFLLLASLTLFFAPLLIYLIILRNEAPTWPPPDAPPLPRLMWLSTGILAMLSVSLHLGTVAIRAGRGKALVNWLLLALGLLGAFVLNQAICWHFFVGDPRAINSWRLVGMFHVFMLIHAAHVIGGVVPLLIVTRNAEQRRYSAKRFAGVRYCAAYWHFLDVVWIIMLIALLAPGGE